MNQSHYERFREEYSFDAVAELINNLPAQIREHNPDAYDEFVTDERESILSDVSLDTLDRIGPRTMHETRYLRYKFDRPGVTVRLAGVYNSNTDTLQRTVVRVTLGDHPNSTVVRFTVRDDSHIEHV